MNLYKYIALTFRFNPCDPSTHHCLIQEKQKISFGDILLYVSTDKEFTKTYTVLLHLKSNKFISLPNKVILNCFKKM